VRTEILVAVRLRLDGLAVAREERDDPGELTRIHFVLHRLMEPFETSRIETECGRIGVTGLGGAGDGHGKGCADEQRAKSDVRVHTDCSVADGLAVLAHLGCAPVHVMLGVPLDGLIAAEAAAAGRDLVAASRQLLLHGRIEARLHFHGADSG